MAQAFHTLYHTDHPVLLGAPTGSGKTISAELTMMRLFSQHPGQKVRGAESESSAAECRTVRLALRLLFLFYFNRNEGSNASRTPSDTLLLLNMPCCCRCRHHVPLPPSLFCRSFTLPRSRRWCGSASKIGGRASAAPWASAW